MNHLLVVDDDRELVELLREYLVPEGFQVDAAFDQSSGMREALSGEDELVILDVMLPGGSGFELLKQLRTTSSFRFCCSPLAATPSIALWDSKSAPTTTCPSLSIRENWLHGFALSCVAPGARRKKMANGTKLASETSHSLSAPGP